MTNRATRSAAGVVWRAVLRRRREQRRWRREVSAVDLSHLVESLAVVYVDHITIDEWCASPVTIEMNGRWG